MPAAIPLLVSLAITGAGYSAAYAAAGSLFTALLVGSYQASQAKRKARDAYNASLTDRLVANPTTDKARSRVYGRVRNSDGLIFKATYGDKSQFYVVVHALAAHEIDGIEDVFFDDEKVLFGVPFAQGVERAVIGVVRTETFASQYNNIGDQTQGFKLKTKPSKTVGAVTAFYTAGTTIVPVNVVQVYDDGVTISGAPRADGTITIRYRPDPTPYLKVDPTSKTEAFSGSGVATRNLAGVPATGVRVIVKLGGEGGNEGTAPATVNVAADGLSATVTVDLTQYAELGTVPFNVMYQDVKEASKASIWAYLGTPGVTPTALLKQWFPSLITDAHRFDGMALLVTRFEYDTDLYPNGAPSVSGVLRGARVLDWRTGQTVWTENNALIAHDWARYKYGGDCAESELDMPWFTAAANACDVRHNFAIADANFPGAIYTGISGKYLVDMPIYTCGIVCQLDQDPYASLGEMVEAMAGKFGWSGGKLRVRAGAYNAPALTIDESWLSGTSSIDIVPESSADDAVNIYVPTIADKVQVYVPAPAPAVRAEDYIAVDGRELPRDITLGAVTDIYHAQNVCGVLLRDERNGMTIKLPCNLRAMGVGLFETHYISLERFGWVNKPVEVTGWEFTPANGVILQLKETAALIFNPDSGFSSSDATPNTLLPNPLAVPALTGFDVDTSVGLNSDGGYVTITEAFWDAASTAAVRESGTIEVAYLKITVDTTNDDLDSPWPSAIVGGDSTTARVLALDSGAYYLFKGRAINSLGVRSAWSVPQVLAKIATVPGLTWDSIVGKPVAYRALSLGFHVSTAPAFPQGVTVAATNAPVTGTVLVRRSFNAYVFDLGTKQFEHFEFCDVLANGGDAGNPSQTIVQFANYLNGLPNTKGVVITTSDEPSGNHTDPALVAALLRCGASRSAFVDRVKYRGAYILIGRAGCGEGNGFERIGGATDNDPNAWAIAYFSIDNGDFVTGNSYTPASSKTFRQDVAPTGAAVADGDFWFDTDDQNHEYVRENGAWVTVRDAGISAALQAASEAVSTADGKIDLFFQDNEPDKATSGLGDLWFDTNDGNKQYVLQANPFGTRFWVPADDQRLGQALTAASNAQATANTKVTTFWQAGQPGSIYYPPWTASVGPAIVGDLWFETTTGRLWRLNHVPGVYIGWDVQSTVGPADITTAKLAAQAATVTMTSNTKPGNVSIGAQTTGYFGYGNLVWRNDTSAPVPVQFEATTIAGTQYYQNTGGSYFYLEWTINGGIAGQRTAQTVFAGPIQYGLDPFAGSVFFPARINGNTVGQAICPAGATITAAMILYLDSTANFQSGTDPNGNTVSGYQGFSVTVENIDLRLTAIIR